MARRGYKTQQRSADERRKLYETVVGKWARGSSLPLVFADNSDSDLASIEAQVPEGRRKDFEFVRVPKYRPHGPGATEKLPSGARLDMGRIEAQRRETEGNDPSSR